MSAGEASPTRNNRGQVRAAKPCADDMSMSWARGRESLKARREVEQLGPLEGAG
jgi:hypothetical protein